VLYFLTVARPPDYSCSQFQARPYRSFSVVPLNLRDYQIEACDAADRAWEEGLRRLLVVMPTGTGKTPVFSESLRRTWERTRGRGLVLAHRDELLEQAAAKIKLVHPDVRIGFVRREQNEVDADVVIASVQSVSRANRISSFPQDFSLVICDEAHHAVSPQFRTVLSHVGVFSEDANAPRLLGVTATPQRADKVGLNEIFQKVVFKLPLLDSIIKGHLCDLRVSAIRVSVDLNKVKGSRGDFDEGALGAALMAANAPAEIIASYQRVAAGRKALCFTPTVEMTRAVVEAARADGIRAEWLSGETPLEERRAILKRLASGETMFLSNAGVLTEGFDERSLECIIIARPTKSVGLYQQMCGRGTRTSPETNKRDCILIDLVGASDTLKLVSLSSITGLPSALLAKMSVLEAVRHQQRLAEEAEARAAEEAQRRLVKTAAPNPFTEFSWVRLPGDFQTIFTLSLGQGAYLYVIPSSPEQYDVLRYDRALPECANGMVEVLNEGLPLDYALGSAEDVVRDSDAMRIAVAGAGWRSDDASLKQRDLLKRCNVSAHDRITKGEAADLITAHFARQTLERIMQVTAQC
jgi:ATP-dependent helicase IRC3